LEPLGGVGVLVLVLEVLCGCTSVVGFLLMIVYGTVCLGNPEGEDTGCGPAGNPEGGFAMLALGWLPCTCCLCICLLRKIRHRRARVAPQPGSPAIGMDVYYAKQNDVVGTTTGPIPLFDAAVRVLQQAVTPDMIVWPATTARLQTEGVEEATTAATRSTMLVSECVDTNKLWIHRQRDWDDHRRINHCDMAGWGGPRQQVFEELRLALFSGTRVLTPVSVNVYDWTGRKAVVAMNKWACCGCRGGGLMGAFHAGVEVLGREYSYGWNDEGTTGVFWVEPKGAEALFGHRFREQIVLGMVSVTLDELTAVVESLEKEWMGYM
jgi:hypothetical protein